MTSLDDVLDAVKAVDAKVENLRETVTEHRVSVEHRVTKLEVRSSFLGAIFGAIGGALAHFFGKS